MYFTDHELDQLLTEDIPFYDLTTSLLKLGNKPAKIQFTTRHETLVCCTEEVLKIFSKLNIHPTLITPSGEFLEAKVKFLEGEGLAKNIHAAWRTCSNLMEYASGIATRTKKLVDKAKEANPDIVIATTRKTIPFTKKIALKAVRSGGASIHRVNLSESILIFKNHYKFLGGLDSIDEKLKEQKNLITEKNITLEVKTKEEALTVSKKYINVLQMDKMPAEEVKNIVDELRPKYPNLKFAAAGGITYDNIGEYARTGVDLLVTSWPYYATPAEFTVSIEPIYDF